MSASKPSILLTGTSGYLGGTVLSQLLANPSLLPRNVYAKIYCLVRTDAQVKALTDFVTSHPGANSASGDHGIEPIQFDYLNVDAASKVLKEKGISVVFYLIDAFSDKGQRVLIEALGRVKGDVGGEVHFLHTTGAKLFSSHAGAPTDRPLLDNEERLYEVQKAQVAPVKVMQTAITTNNTVVELSEKYGVKSYIFAPCIVYGKGEGFGNPVSIQTKAIVEAAKGTRRVYAVDEGEPSWPVCHVIDNATLYLQILSSILSSKNTPSGKQGYYLASPGAVKWIDLYRAMAKTLLGEGVIDTDEVTIANEKEVAAMAKALKCEPDFVAVQLGGKCTFEARRGSELGWTPRFEARHAVESAAEEVKLILANL